MKIEVDDEMLDRCIVQSLRQNYRWLKEESRPPIFSYDPEENLQEIKKARAAFKYVIEHYGGKVNDL